MSKRPHSRDNRNRLSKNIALYVTGLALIVVAIFIVLKQFGLFSAIPGYVFLVIALIIIGISLIAGVNKSH